MADRPDEVAQTVGGLVAQMVNQAAATGQPEVPEDLAEEQASSQLLFSMVIACYHAVDQELVERLHGGAKATADEEERLFKLAANPPRPTRRQYLLVESVMKEERDRMMQEMSPGDMVGGINILGRGMTGRQKLAYALAMIVVVFGAGLWFLRRFMREKPARQRTQKAMRRVLKAEALLEKKARPSQAKALPDKKAR